MPPKQDIVVTGVGVVSPIGIGKDAFWAALREGRSGVRRFDMPVGPDAPPPIGGQVVDFDPRQYVRPRKSIKVMSRDIQLAFAAADMACTDAGLPQRPVDPERLGVVFGAGVIPCELDELARTCRTAAVDGHGDLRRWGPAAMAEMYPLWMLKYLPNMPACHIGIGQDARGPNNSITLGDVSSLSALAEGVRVLERDQADALIVGGVGAQLYPGQWTRGPMLGMSRRGDDPAAACRPFDASRDGIVNGEGSAAFFFEPRPLAEKRGAVPLARVLGYAGVFEPLRRQRSGNVATNDRLGNAIRRAILAALHDADVSAADVGLVVAHGLGAIDDDRFEARAIRDTLGDVPVTAPKSYFGHLGTAAGALETAVAVMAIQHGLIPPTLNYEHPDPQCPVNVIHGQPAVLSKPVAIIVSYSFHGQTVAVVLGQV
jgi:3-oxoacyl-[acyl-carrier-protein] synthase II